jgi:hypothetical protein
MTEQDTEERNLTRKGNGRSLTFTLPERMYMDLLIKIRHENLGWKRFFSFIIQGFIDDDPRITEYLDERMKKIRAKYRTKALQKERIATAETKKKFNLDEDEIENIYDILEEEFDP